MKILGTQERHGEPHTFIVQMDDVEMRKILGRDSYSRGLPHGGAEVDVSKRYNHAMAILSQAQDATRLPSQLKTLGELIEMSMPAIKETIEEIPATT